jgi:hypothetical protein
MVIKIFIWISAKAVICSEATTGIQVGAPTSRKRPRSIYPICGCFGSKFTEVLGKAMKFSSLVV